jgi:GNAT superfamily N-acetyltransferase
MVGRVYQRSWRAAFGSILTVDMVSDAALLTMSRALVQAPMCLVVTLHDRDTVDGTVVGFAAGGDSAGHLDVLYVDPTAWGTGAAGLLLRAATDRLSRTGARPWLWVWKSNARALAFYTRLGWVATGEERTRIIEGHTFCYRKLEAPSPAVV